MKRHGPQKTSPCKLPLATRCPAPSTDQSCLKSGQMKWQRNDGDGGGDGAGDGGRGTSQAGGQAGGGQAGRARGVVAQRCGGGCLGKRQEC